MKIEKVEPAKYKQSSISEVVDRIFAICKTEKNFPLRNQTEETDSKIEKINEKIQKQEKLLQRSQELKNDLGKRIEVLNEAIFESRSNSLESLGSEL